VPSQGPRPKVGRSMATCTARRPSRDWRQSGKPSRQDAELPTLRTKPRYEKDRDVATGASERRGMTFWFGR
jgi:hypothetical protein